MSPGGAGRAVSLVGLAAEEAANDQGQTGAPVELFSLQASRWQRVHTWPLEFMPTNYPSLGRRFLLKHTMTSER